ESRIVEGVGSERRGDREGDGRRLRHVADGQVAVGDEAATAGTDRTAFEANEREGLRVEEVGRLEMVVPFRFVGVHSLHRDPNTDRRVLDRRRVVVDMGFILRERAANSIEANEPYRELDEGVRVIDRVDLPRRGPEKRY